MLSDSKLTDYSYIVAARFEAINTHYIKLMAKQIREIGQLSPSNIYRLQQMTKMQQNIDTINYLLAQETGRTLEELYQIYDMSGMSLYGDTYKLYTARGISQVPFEQNTTIQQYLEKKSTLHSIITQPNDGFVYTVDIDDKIHYHNIKLVPIANLPEEYTPTENSYYAFEIEDNIDLAAISQNKEKIKDILISFVEAESEKPITKNSLS